MILRIITVALSWYFITALSPTAHATPVRIAYSSISAAMLPMFVAKDKRLFDKYGVDTEVTYIRGVAI